MTLKAGVTLRVETPHIYFDKIARPLVKDGELNGRFSLLVGVQEVRFGDGSAWVRGARAPAQSRASCARRPRSA